MNLTNEIEMLLIEGRPDDLGHPANSSTLADSLTRRQSCQ
jgi:hypothetical protein